MLLNFLHDIFFIQICILYSVKCLQKFEIAFFNEFGVWKKSFKML